MGARLFISYKRGDEYAIHLKEALKDVYFAVWFDRESIRLGDPDWQESIVNGISRSDAVILCLSPRALDSDPIKFEMRVAQSNGRLILPVMVDAINSDDIPGALETFNLPPRAQVEDLYSPATWQNNFDKLLSDLAMHGIRPSRHDIRQKRKGQEYRLHQQYLRRLVTEWGHVRIRDINPDYDGSEMPVEDVYVPLRSDVRFILDIEKYDIRRWWVTRTTPFDEPELTDYPLSDQQIDALDDAQKDFLQRTSGDFASLDLLIENRREELDQQRREDESRRMARLDHAYEVIALDVADAVAVFDRLLLLGEGGSGKSLFCQYLISCLAGGQIENYPRNLNTKRLGRWVHGNLNPVYIKMRGLLPDIEEHGWEIAAVEAYLRRQLGPDLDAYYRDLQSDMMEGQSLIILDGLETALDVSGRELDKRHQDINHLLNTIEAHYGQSRLVIIGQTAKFKYWRPDRLAVAEIAPIPPERATLLATKIYINRTSVSVDDAAQRAEELNDFLSEFNPALAGNARFITLLSTVFPAKRGVLYRQMMALLLKKWTQPKSGVSFAQLLGDDVTAEEADIRLRTILNQVAYDSVELFKYDPVQGRPLRSALYSYLSDIAEYYGVETLPIRNYLSEIAEVFIGDQDDFRFAHEGFRQYFIAEHLRGVFVNTTGRIETSIVRHLIEANAELWSESVRMLADLLVDDQHGGYSDLWQLLDDLLDDNIPQQTTPDNPHLFCAWIAGQIALEQGISFANIRRHETVYMRDIQSWLTLLIKTPRAPQDRNGHVNMRRRAQAGRALGYLGDDREGVGVVSNRPDIVWCNVPAGEVAIGKHPEDPYAAFDDQKLYTVTVDDFTIARYPVTYAQYELFVQAKGYDIRRYWDDAGWQWRDKHQHPSRAWNDPRWHISNHPVVGVTWYEASAYCRWLSEILGYEVRLPTSAEWQRAAQGDDNRLFPYGSDFDALKGNVRQTGVGRTTAVGLFPQGAITYGDERIEDLAGNVYEWCADSPDDAPQHALTPRILRGGSWMSYPGFTRATAIYADYPNFVTLYWGFRVAR